MKSALANFQTLPLKEASRALLAEQGYFREHKLQRNLLFHDEVAQILEESHTKPRSHEGGKGKVIVSDSENLRASASSRENSSEVSSENLRAFVPSWLRVSSFLEDLSDARSESMKEE